MRGHPKLLAGVLLLSLLLLACDLGGGGATPTPAPAAPTTSPTLEPYTFFDAANGVRVRYPAGWEAQSDTSGSALTLFVSPDPSLTAYLYVTSGAGGDLQSEAKAVFAEVMSGLAHTVEQDQAVTLMDGTPAWWILASATLDDGTEIRILEVAALYGAREFVLLALGPSETYDYYADDIQELAYAMHFEAPAAAGLSHDQTLYLSGGESTNPRDYDPATTHSAGDKRAFSGLVSFDPQLNLVPELAETWEISPDGTVFTFHLRPNARFHDGRAVTAQDVVYSWERAADPDSESDTVLTYLGDIVGIAEMHAGEAQHISGLTVIDDLTLQVAIDAPKPYFLLKLTYPTAFVVDRANVESGPEWYRTPNGTGPYKLVEWERFQRMVYEANPDFYLGEPAIGTIVIQLFSGVDIRLYESGEIDVAGVSNYDVPRVSEPSDPLHAELRSSADLCTYYIVFDASMPPFDDVKVRQAFSMAFDRQKYIDVVMNGVGLPAAGVFPPALPGYDLGLQGLPFDPEQARRTLAESTYGGPDGLPPIAYTNAGIGSNSGPSVSAIAQMWEQYLGVEITVENLDPDYYYDLLYSGRHGQIFDGGWCADYPDPENFADALFHTGAQQNLGGYSNASLDTLLDQARVEQDTGERIRLYQQAERIIVQDAPALFTVHGISYVLVKPYVKGYVLTPIDIPLERYLWLEP
jgi:oligopeptide transport system substrate-binding protein